jgi:exodeoxyribonuclease VII large subunit
VKVEATIVGDRKVYSVSAFNGGVAGWIARLPSVWVEGEVTELRRHAGWANAFFTLKDPADGSCLPAAMRRQTFDALDLGLLDGERIHVFGRPELIGKRGEFRLRALSIERYGLGAHLAALERLKRSLAAEGLFSADRKRALPRFPRRIGIVTGGDAAARGDIVTSIQSRFPPARLLVAETLLAGPKAAANVVAALRALAAEPGVDVIVVTRGGGSFEDLLPFSDETLVRAVAASPVPVVSAVGHEQDTPLCDLAADARASTPTAAARLVVPDLGELHERLARAHAGLERGARRRLDQDAQGMKTLHERLGRAPALLVERRRAALDRAYAIVRSGQQLVTTGAHLEKGDAVDVELASGGFGATVDEVRE